MSGLPGRVRCGRVKGIGGSYLDRWELDPILYWERATERVLRHAVMVRVVDLAEERQNGKSRSRNTRPILPASSAARTERCLMNPRRRISRLTPSWPPKPIW